MQPLGLVLRGNELALFFRPTAVSLGKHRWLAPVLALAARDAW